MSGRAVIGCAPSLFLCDDEKVLKCAPQLVTGRKRYSVTEAARRDLLAEALEMPALRILDVVRRRSAPNCNDCTSTKDRKVCANWNQVSQSG